MTATSDLVMERRRMRRRLAFWRVLAIVALVGIAAFAAVRLGGGGGQSGGDYVARISITGMIVDDPKRDREIRSLADDDRVKALIVRINSPGGTVTGSEALHVAIRDVAAKKPVVAEMGEAAASGGYITALAADHIVSRATSLTGSIGVVGEMPNIAGLLDRLGVDVFRVKSAPLKAEPSLLTPPPPGALEEQQRLIDDSYQWFRELVGERRGFDEAKLDEIANGRVFTGREAIKLGLVDQIGGEEAALGWLDEAHGIPADTKVRERDWREEKLPFPFSVFDDARAMLTGEIAATPVLAALSGPRLYAIMH